MKIAIIWTVLYMPESQLCGAWQGVNTAQFHWMKATWFYIGRGSFQLGYSAEQPLRRPQKERKLLWAAL